LDVFDFGKVENLRVSGFGIGCSLVNSAESDGQEKLDKSKGPVDAGLLWFPTLVTMEL
jgi:hypothetical protein